MNLWMGSSWWSVGGQAADFIGFALLTIDLLPDFAGTRIRRLNEQLREGAAKAFESAWENRLEKLNPEQRRFAREVANRSQGLWSDSTSVPDSVVLDVRKANPLVNPDEWGGQEYWTDLWLVREATKAARAGAPDFPTDDLGDGMAARQEALVNRDDRIRLRRAFDQLIDKAVRLQPVFFPWQTVPKRAPGASVIEMVWLASNALGAAEAYLDRRRRPPLWLAVALILAGFLAQVWGSIPVDQPWTVLVAPDPWS